MAIVKPFKAVRPVRDKAHLVVSRSYITYGSDELSDKLQGNPYSFIHIINPDHNEVEKTKPNSPERFIKVKQKYDLWVNKGYIKQDAEAGYYIYRQSSKHSSFTGIIAGTSTQDYENDVIKKHEQTLTKREEVFSKYLDSCSFHAEPVLMAHENSSELNEIIKNVSNERPDFEFTTTDKVKHELWPIFDANLVAKVEGVYAKMPAIYIADGHHRSASSLRLANKRKAEQPAENHSAAELFMSYLLPESELRILPFHRLVKSSLKAEDILRKLENNFLVSKITTESWQANSANEIGFFTGKDWFSLELKSEFQKNTPLEVLPPQILSDNVLAPIFDVTDLRTDKNIDFIGGAMPTTELEKKVVNDKFDFVFFLHPVTMQQLVNVANAGLNMPPKSTYIEPKLRSCLTVYEF